MKINPIISIIIPHFNRVELLKETIDSLLKQTRTDWQALIIDDGSTNDTINKIKDFIQTDARLTLMSRNRLPKGPTTCRNIGIETALGEYIIFLDSDDLLAPWALEERIKHLEKSKDLDFIVFPTLKFFNKAGDDSTLVNVPNSENDLLRFLKFDLPWCITGPIWHKTALKKLNGFNENAPNLQDWELHIRALANGMNYKVVNVLPDAFYRTHDGPRVARVTSVDILNRRMNLFVKIIEFLKVKKQFDKQNRNHLLEVFISHLLELAVFQNAETTLVNKGLEIVKIDFNRPNLWVSTYLKTLELFKVKTHTRSHRILRRIFRVFIHGNFQGWKGSFGQVSLPDNQMQRLISKLNEANK